MNTVVLGVIILTAIASFLSFPTQNFEAFEKYKFNVGAVLRRKEYYRILTAGLLHADITHLVLNMYTLYLFAPIVVQVFGNIGFLIIYLGAIILGNVFSLSLYKNTDWYSAIGASGGVSGIVFAAIAFYPDIEIFFMPGYIYGFLYFAYSVYSMLYPRQGDIIGHSAHLGGAFLGLVYVIITYPEAAQYNALYLGIMALPLVYLGYEVFVNKRI